MHAVVCDHFLERETVGRFAVGAVHVGLKVFHRRKRRLTRIADQILALLIDALQHAVVGCPVGQIGAQIHALDRGDAPGGAVAHGRQDRLLQLLVGQVWDIAVNGADGGLLQVAVGFAVFAEDDFAALDRMVILIEPHGSQQHGIHGTCVLAAPDDGHGDLGGDAVQIVLIGKPSVPFRPVVFPPALALQALAVRVLLQVFPAGPDDVFQVFALRQIRHHHLLAQVDQMHVGVVEPGNDGPAFAVDRLRVRAGGGEHLFVPAH